MSKIWERPKGVTRLLAPPLSFAGKGGTHSQSFTVDSPGKNAENEEKELKGEWLWR